MDETNDTTQTITSQLPGLAHHQIKICVLVDGCTHASIVVQELLPCDLSAKAVIEEKRD
jgi:hypothetical protein